MITNDSVFHRSAGEQAEPVQIVSRDGLSILIDPITPNWIGVDSRSVEILNLFDGERSFGGVVHEYAGRTGFEFARAWQDVATLAGDAIRHEYISPNRSTTDVYTGREAALGHRPLREVWLHTNNSCNLACSHCLVSSGPDGDRGLPLQQWLDVINSTRALGAQRFFITGGEPFIRKDMIQILDAILFDPVADVAVLTNGIPLKGQLLEELSKRDRTRLRLQISLDGAKPATNDAIRGSGSYERIIDGIRNAVGAGFPVTVTSTVTHANAEEIPEITRIVGELGVKNHHLLWLHRRGRADAHGPDTTPSNDEIVEVVRRARTAGTKAGVIIDNHEALKARLKSPRGTRHDLAAAGVESLCVYCDGKVYPSAATVNIPELFAGDIRSSSLEEIWKTSPVFRNFRSATVEKKEICRTCPLKFLCGGGDIEHAYFYAGSIAAHDPYCGLHTSMIQDALLDLTAKRKSQTANGQAGFKAPVIFAAMGEGAVNCATEAEESDTHGPKIRTIRSECVLSFDIEAPRTLVREFYGDAAEKPQAELCCPVRPSADDLKHIPPEVVERFYGCGSPVQDAEIQPGETTLDLGSGAGIDVFISSKKTGRDGRSIGVDMTDSMLKVAQECRPRVAEALGYDNVEFRKGFLEEIPVETAFVDLVTSNCVINLSADKPAVLAEIWRVLKDHGRLCVSDIVSETEVPPHQRKDPRLWGECISGALTEEELIAYLERAGFYGIQVLKRNFWKEVEGYRFFSVTVRAYKFEKKSECIYRGQKAVYQGPFKGISDEEGHWFPRQIPVEICTDTASKLSAAPYDGQFVILDSDGTTGDFACCSPGSGQARLGSCC